MPEVAQRQSSLCDGPSTMEQRIRWPTSKQQRRQAPQLHWPETTGQMTSGWLAATNQGSGGYRSQESTRVTHQQSKCGLFRTIDMEVVAHVTTARPAGTAMIDMHPTSIISDTTMKTF